MYYEFLCRCGHVFGVLRPVAKAPGWARRCPKCRKMAGRNLASAPAVHGDFKPYYSMAMGKGYNGDGSKQPGLHGETYDHRDRLLVKSRSHLKQLKRQLGLREIDSYTE